MVRYPWGGESRLSSVRADRIVEIAAPRRAPARAPVSQAPVVAGCSRTGVRGQSVARIWDEAAVAALRAGDAATPVQARDLFDLSAAMNDAWTRAQATVAARETAISYAAYRLLLWRASFGSNLSQTFAVLTAQLHALCYSPDFTSTAGNSPAALGNRIAAAAIAAGGHDGSLEALHYVDAGYVPMNGPLVVGQAGSTVHDPTFWQPLALAQIAAHGLGAIPAKIQSFVGSQWGHVRAFALPASSKGLPIDPGPPPFGDPSSATYKNAAVAVIRATSRKGTTATGSSPLDWNARANMLPDRSLQHDVHLYLALNGALNDAAVAAFGAKRVYQAPRPISMIRYLAFQGQSSDPKALLYNADGLPLVPGLIELKNGQVEVLSQGHWVPGARWTPPAATPASPGWVSEQSAFDAAAAQVLGRPFVREAAALAARGVAAGIETPADATAGWKLGTAVGRRAVAKTGR